MARDPGYLVIFTDHEGNEKKGRTFNRIKPIDGKICVYHMGADYKPVYEEKNGQKVWKCSLVDPAKMRSIGMCD